jgi:hypothetical protein
VQVGFQIMMSLIPYGIGIAWGISNGKIWTVEGISVSKELQRTETARTEMALENPVIKANAE